MSASVSQGHGSAHDPMCPVLDPVNYWDDCQCDLIARVREDEAVKRRADLIWQDGYDTALRDSVEAVKGCPCPQGYSTNECSCSSDAVAAIEALGGER